MTSARILLLFNEPVLPSGHPDYESEAEILITVKIIAEILAKADFTIEKVGVGNDPSTLLTGLERRASRPGVQLVRGAGGPHRRRKRPSPVCWNGSNCPSPGRPVPR